MDKLTELVRLTFRDRPEGEFRPFAEYNKKLDMIIVLVRDCSYIEIPRRAGVSILMANYPTNNSQPELVGLTIYDAASFCRMQGISFDGKTLPLARLLGYLRTWLPDVRDMPLITNLIQAFGSEIMTANISLG